jgi:hypothetical protein
MTLLKSGWRGWFASAATQDSSRNEKPNRTFAPLLLLIAAVVCTQSTGCLGPNRPHTCGNMVDGMFSNFRERVWANRAFNLEYRHMPRKFREHFRKGFVEGYCTVCNGGDGYIPAMPPRDYWGYEYQSSDGAQCVSAWFEGYPEGVAAARKLNAGKNADMYISSMAERAIQQEKEGVRLASQVGIVGSGSNQPAKSTASQPQAVESAAPPAPISSRQDPNPGAGKEAVKPAALSPQVPQAPSGPSMVVGQGDF